MLIIKKALVVLVAIGVLASLLSALPNEISGWQERNVEIAVDIDEVRVFSEDLGLSQSFILSEMRELGVTAVAVRETSIRRYAREGSLTLLSGGEILASINLRNFDHNGLELLARDGRVVAHSSYIITEDEAIAEKILARLSAAFGRQARLVWDEKPYVLEIEASVSSIEALPLGMHPDDVAMLQDMGLRLVARPANNVMGSESSVRGILSEYALLPEGFVSAVVFDGVEAGGFPNHLDVASEVLKENNLRVGFVELVARQRGIEEIMRRTGYSGITVHSNMRGRPVQSIVNAVLERGARLLYVRFHIERRPASLDDALTFLEDISTDLNRYGFRMGVAADSSNAGTPFLHIVSLFGLSAALLLFAQKLGLRLKPLLFALSAAFFLVMVSLYFLSQNNALQLASIVTALIFPVIAVSAIDFGGETQSGKTLIFMASNAVRVFAIALLGGIMVAGFNSTPHFTSGAALFRGVTLTNTFPFLPIFWIIFLKIRGGKGEIDLKESAASLVSLLKKYVNWIQILSLAVAAGALAVFIARLGHTAGMPLFPFEEVLRRFLDDVLIVRPRTKEFLIAYPALVFGLSLLAKGKRGIFTGILLAVGALAPISVVNTFGHFTNPTLLASASFRSFNGLWLGCVIGLAIVVFLPFGIKLLKALMRNLEL